MPIAAAAAAPSPPAPGAAPTHAISVASSSQSSSVVAVDRATAVAAAAAARSAAGDSLSAFVPPANFPPYRPPSGPPPRPSGHFSTLLYAYIRTPRPSSLQDSVFFEDEQFTIIYDAYPKARVHLLMLPRKKQIAQVADLSQLKKHKLKPTLASCCDGAL